MRVLIACEYSAVVRTAFRSKGHHAFSCDILPTEGDCVEHHFQCDVREVLYDNWDLIIAHPPCTYLCVSGNRWYSESKEREEAVEFFRLFLEAPCPKVCVENPVGVISTRIRKPDQYIQPWQFGHGETKKTGLWLKGLPLLRPTNIVEGREQRIWKMPPSLNRGLERSRTYSGIATAMADQWGQDAPR